MAEHLARLIFTEQDRVNCPFYWKIGACRHGDQCSRAHHKPTASQTVIMYHLYQNPPVAIAIAEGQDVPDEIADQACDHFEAFYEEVFAEMAKYGELEDIIVCDNIGDHMVGNTYVKFVEESSAAACLKALQGKFYGGKAIEAEMCPVTDFKESRCRQYIEGRCPRGGYCNFMHIKHVPRSCKRKLFRKMYDEHGYGRDKDDRGDERGERDEGRKRERSGSRSREEDHGQRMARQSSEERRAMVAAWNDDDDDEDTGGAATNGNAGGS
uniref:C3H1-type domain-containing protein n=1 Tax=Chromera velia CCMP2878 TaxID=1169474 RepID=A0A0G4G9F2_9ALVE|mmetsp:Transcript_27249/g.53499  ORF Transcript_27249/g.53499 Transcript_27249/m.53499 type:complete len:268 (+) Transcript_27249:270-1073(+)|eukprot:Cvel_593.t1-p1 / transcript=Cvel_593.t1 / gene=Cvel_593 / organism=Chromera_velia_CCMP2878 / gene_product=Splicing factor U2af small subunit B, putative / transcript_product=Splicing factor U2af small subunit B, putative / location=Cvel_scaffold18:122702-126941(-) / protein_length=267 / sequence_SO=supercontig / SO=protein_coding / is_pseudo=false